MSDTATTDTAPEATEPAAPETPPPATPGDDLGDAGKKAIAAERAARKAAEKQAADLAAQVKAFEDASKSEAEKAAARAEAAEKALAEVTAKAARLQVAAEVGVPADLVEFLTGSDEESLRAQAEKLMAATAASKAPRAPQPDPSQGAKPGATASQLTSADLKGMGHDAINAARAEGRLNDLLGIKS
jgi:hypothetical protein